MSNFFSRRREPFTFMLQLGIAGSAILFLFILFVFLKKDYDHHLIPVPLPTIFTFSTIAIVASSLTLVLSKKAFYQENFKQYRFFITATFVLGILFMGLQLVGWQQLLSADIRLDNHTGGAFVYVLSGIHIFHTLVGIVALAYLIKEAFSNQDYVDSFIYSVNPPNQLRLKLTSMYWHFIDILWLILYLFLLVHAI